jgi:aromatic ring-opening dioxygenase LigB subunit
MAVTIAGMASSHAHTFAAPADWDRRRQRTRNRFKAKYGNEPPEVPSVEGETLESNQRRYGHIRERLDALKRDFEAFEPDVLVILGDDQDEHYREHIPQFAIYTGERLRSVDRDTGGDVKPEYRCDAALAEHLYARCVEAGFDLMASKAFNGDELISHAHAQILSFLQPKVPIVPIFLNAIHVPSPTPERCYQFGRELRRALEAWPGDLKAAVYASGGLSHFSAGFPYPAYHGPNQLGSIAEDFDHEIFGWLRNGEGAKLATLSSSTLLDNGEVELRQWIALMGVLGARKPAWLVYEPFYRAIMGMGVGYWPPPGAN